MSNKHRHEAVQIVEFDMPVQGSWSTPVALKRFGRGGRFTYFTLRGPPSSTVTEVDVMVWIGGDDNSTDASLVDPTTITEAKRVFYRTGITVAGDATDADDTYALNDGVGHVYNVQAINGQLWFAAKSATATAADADFEASFHASDVH